jgi:uncharacterized repeat protein (TIGR01451 family)
MRRTLHPILLSLVLTCFESLFLFPAWGQTITTVAGNGIGNYSGDGGPATLATINQPDDIAFDSKGNYYIADAGNAMVRKVDIATGIISTYAGASTQGGYSGDGGPATLATFFYPSGIAFDSQDNLYIADYYNDVIREVYAATGIVNTVIGNGLTGYSGDGGPALSAELNAPIGIRFDTRNNLYIADSNNNVIRMVNGATGIITTVAGTGVPGYSGDGGPATLARLNGCEMVEPDPSGNLYISDFYNDVFRKVSFPTGTISTIAGTGNPGYSGDGGLVTLADFYFDNGTMAFGCGGNLFMTDDMNNVIRAVSTATGIVNTVAGNGVAGYLGDGGPATLAEFDHTESIAFDSSGSLYVVDYNNNVVRKISNLCGPTLSPTLTPTATSTQTPTQTSTTTFSPTATPTSTLTPTPTLSFTSTTTSTLTQTPTATITPTTTATPSSTFTPSMTPTTTPWLILGKTVSTTTAQSGDLLTYALSVTLSGGSFNNITVMDTLPAGVSFVSLSVPSAGSVTYSQGTDLVNWTLPSPLSPGTYQFTFQVQVASFVPSGTSIPNQAALFSSELAQPLNAGATVVVSGVYTVQAGVYNEAGELIRSLWLRKYSQPVSSLDLTGSPLTALNGANGQIGLYSNGVSLGIWDGTNSSGGPVANGTYFIEIKNVDPNGVVSTVTRPAVVSRSLFRVAANIYNGAGELVKHLYGWINNPTSAQLTGVVLSQTVIQPGSTGPASSVQMIIQTSGTAVTLSWDGTGDSGGFVSSGDYIFSVHWDQGDGTAEDISRIVQVKGGEGNNAGNITACPNILTKTGGTFKTRFKTAPVPPSTMRAKIYNIAGEKVAVIQGDPGTGQVDWDATGCASGYYLAVVQLLNANGGVSSRQTLKIIISR